MSKTYRRKNYEQTQNSSWDRAGKKKFGIHATWNYDNYPDLIQVYRVKTKQEQIKAYIRTHCDGDHFKYSNVPGWFCNIYERGFRQANKREILKYIRQEDYEPMCSANPRDLMWDWD